MRLAPLFSDNMVLQQELPLPVWGWGEAGEQVTVRIAGKEARTKAGKNGAWQLRLPPLKAGGPFEMTIEGQSTQVLRNVLVGEVWVCSGQSNMKMCVKESRNGAQEIARANYPNIRLFTVPRISSVEPLTEFDPAWVDRDPVYRRTRPVGERGTKGAVAWEVCGPETVGEFSAAAYFCGRDLHRNLRVPIGLINTSEGATRAEAWTSRAGLCRDPLYRKEVREYEKGLADFPRRLAEYEALVAKGEMAYYPADPGNQGYARGWAAPGTDIADWGEMAAPGYWNAQGLDFSGVVWFRKEIEIPAAWAGRDLYLHLGGCDKTDITYFNNVQVGAVGLEDPNSFQTPREYVIPGALVKPGVSVIAVRIYSYAFDGGFRGPWDAMNIVPVGAPKAKPISLVGTWRYKVEHNFGKIKVWRELRPMGPGTANSPYGLFNGMLWPLIPYAIRGALWHQGGSNLEKSYDYRRLFPLMIEDWRAQWGRKDLWFHFVQQENCTPRDRFPVESAWAELREAQLMTLKLPRTTMTVTIDIGETYDVHPKNKQELGRRLALCLRATTYAQKDVIYSGPVYKSCAREGGKLRLKFTQLGGGLVTKRGKLKGFAVAGADRKFVWAQARIDGQTVLVWHPDVPKPAAARYGWAPNPDCNLYNKAGLPASPFRTDTWPGITETGSRPLTGIDSVQVR